MRKLGLDELEAGMVLAVDVEVHDGFRVLARGTVLTEKQLDLLSTWNVLEVAVEDEKADKGAHEAAVKAEDEALAAARRRLAKLFEGQITNEWMEALHGEAEKRLAVPRYWQTQV